jgi:hypothetical protein
LRIGIDHDCGRPEKFNGDAYFFEHFATGANFRRFAALEQATRNAPLLPICLTHKKDGAVRSFDHTDGADGVRR